MRPQSGEVWWYRQGAYIATAIVAAGIWFVMIGPKEFTPKSTMVDPAIDTLNTGVPNFQDAGQLSKKLKFRVRPPDLRQLGCKVTRSSIAEFGGQPSAVFQYQYGKSVVLMYSFNNPSVLFKEMKQVHQARSLFYCSSSGPATVVAWKDRRSGYFAIAAKATEKDLVVLAGKIVEAF
jgi:hypothetical protein